MSLYKYAGITNYGRANYRPVPYFFQKTRNVPASIQSCSIGNFFPWNQG